MKIPILHIIKSLGRGGAETLLPETLSLHDREAFEFHYIYFLPWKDQLVDRIREAGGIVVNIPANNNVQLIFQANKVIQYVKKHQIQLIHCHLPWAGFLGRWVYMQTSIPVIYTEHNKQERYHFVTRMLNKWTFRFQTKAIAVSNDVAHSIHQHIQPSIPVEVVQNGVNTSTYDRDKVSVKGLEASLTHLHQDHFIIGTVAVFRFQKRLIEWVEVFKQISNQHPQVRGIIVGDGPLRANIEAHIQKLGLSDKIILAGLQTEVRPWLARMDIFMMSSVFEGLPIALLEAMSMGCTPVTTNAGGIGEVIIQQESGIHVPVDQWQELAHGVSQLIENPEKLQQMKNDARKRVVEYFSLQTMVHTLEKIYKDNLHVNEKKST